VCPSGHIFKGEEDNALRRHYERENELSLGAESAYNLAPLAVREPGRGDWMQQAG
jgi:hypothetical protein